MVGEVDGCQARSCSDRRLERSPVHTKMRSSYGGRRLIQTHRRRLDRWVACVWNRTCYSLKNLAPVSCCWTTHNWKSRLKKQCWKLSSFLLQHRQLVLHLSCPCTWQKLADHDDWTPSRTQISDRSIQILYNVRVQPNSCPIKEKVHCVNERKSERKQKKTKSKRRDKERKKKKKFINESIKK